MHHAIRTREQFLHLLIGCLTEVVVPRTDSEERFRRRDANDLVRLWRQFAAGVASTNRHSHHHSQRAELPHGRGRGASSNRVRQARRLPESRPCRHYGRRVATVAVRRPRVSSSSRSFHAPRRLSTAHHPQCGARKSRHHSALVRTPPEAISTHRHAQGTTAHRVCGRRTRPAVPRWQAVTS